MKAPDKKVKHVETALVFVYFGRSTPGIYAKEPYKVPGMGGFGKHSPWSPGQTRQFKAWKSNHVFFFNPD